MITHFHCQSKPTSPWKMYYGLTATITRDCEPPVEEGALFTLDVGGTCLTGKVIGVRQSLVDGAMEAEAFVQLEPRPVVGGWWIVA